MFRRNFFRFLILLAALISFSFIGNAQEDSLKRALNSQTVDTIKFRDASYLYDYYIKSGNNSEAFKYLSVIRDLAAGIGENKYSAIANQVKANYFYKINQYDSAILYNEKAISLAQEISYAPTLERCYINLGNILMKTDNYTKAIVEFQKAQQEAFKIKDTTGTLIILLNMGNIYYDINDYANAKKKYLKSEEIAVKLGNRAFELGSVYNNLATVYLNQTPVRRDSAMMYYRKYLDLSLNQKDERSMAMAYFNIGEVHRTRSELELAKENYFKARDLYIKQEDTVGLMNVFLGLGDTYVLENKIVEAITILKKALDYSIKYEMVSHTCDIQKSLSNAYYKMGNYKEAIDYYRTAVTISDSIYNAENSEILYEMQTKYESEEKEKENKLLEAQNMLSNKTIREQQQIVYFIVGGLLLVVVFSLFIFRGLQKQRKANRIISLQKEEVHRQKEIIEEKQKEIVDSIHYAKRIQDTLLANKQMIESCFKEYFIFFQPKDIVSGDFYWAAKSENYFFLAACDSTGHGVPGAFMSLLNIGFLNEAVNEKEIYSPAEIFNYVRERLVNSISKEGQKDGFDGILIRMDISTKQIVYAAANNKPVLVSDSESIVLDGDKMPVGYGERKESFKEYIVNYKSGDSLFVYTDGFADQFGGIKGKKFKYKPLDEFLKHNSTLEMEAQQNLLSEKFANWKGDLEQIDDVCVIGIRL